MTIKHNAGSGKTVITLTWAETRQFISGGAAVVKVVDAVAKVVHKSLTAHESKMPRIQDTSKFRVSGDAE